MTSEVGNSRLFHALFVAYIWISVTRYTNMKSAHAVETKKLNMNQEAINTIKYAARWANSFLFMINYQGFGIYCVLYLIISNLMFVKH